MAIALATALIIALASVLYLCCSSVALKKTERSLDLESSENKATHCRAGFGGVLSAKLYGHVCVDA